MFKNSTQDSSTYCEEYETVLFRYCVVVLSLVITVLICMANTLTLMALYKFKVLRTVTNCLVGSLSIMDLCGGLAFLSAVVITSVNVHPDAVLLLMPHTWVLICKIAMTLLCTTIGMSNFCILFIAIDRFIAILYPLRYETIMTQTRVTCVVPWPI